MKVIQYIAWIGFTDELHATVLEPNLKAIQKSGIDITSWFFGGIIKKPGPIAIFIFLPFQ